MLPNLVGHTIGKYHVLERIGQGENAVVYRAQQINLGRLVALKVLPIANKAAYDRLRLESQLLAQLQHPGIRQVISIEEAGPLAYAVLEYADESLKTLLTGRRQEHRPFSRAETVKLLRPIAEVLDYLHSRGLAHMDVKPENILLTTDGRVMLSDFGVSQSFGKPLSRGTPAYVAPEVVKGEPVSAATDIYSLGVVAYEMLAGQPPFTGDAPLTLWRHHTQTLPSPANRVNRNCSNSVAWVVNRALAKAPDERYVSAAAFISALDSADTVSVRLFTLPRRRPWVAATSAMGLMAAAALVILPLSGRWPPPAPVSPTPVSVTAPPSATLLPLTVAPAGTPEEPPATMPPLIQPSATTGPTAAPTQTLAPTATNAPTRTPAPSATATSPPDQPACVNPGWKAGAVIVQPVANATLPQRRIIVRGVANLPTSIGYQLRLYRPTNMADSAVVVNLEFAGKANGQLGVVDAGNLGPGKYLLRLRVLYPSRNYEECDVPIALE